MNSMKPLSIKIKICDRLYPMTINANDEEKIRIATKKLGNEIDKYKKEFGLSDSQDLLAMVAFDCMVQHIKTEAKDENNSIAINQIRNINGTLLGALES